MEVREQQGEDEEGFSTPFAAPRNRACGAAHAASDSSHVNVRAASCGNGDPTRPSIVGLRSIALVALLLLQHSRRRRERDYAFDGLVVAPQNNGPARTSLTSTGVSYANSLVSCPRHRAASAYSRLLRRNQRDTV